MKQLLFLGLAAVAVVLLTIHPSIGFQWEDAPVTMNSLAVEARLKLASPKSSCLPVGDSLSPPVTIKSPRGVYVVIDTHTNRLYVRTVDSILYQALCSTGTGAELIDTGDGRYWRFDTPKGLFRVDSRLANPWWRKPDWAFIEEGEPIPEKDAAERFDPEAMGDFAIGFGDGYFIHGTVFERLIGVSVTHGCVRLRSDDIKTVWEMTKMGTPIIIY
ncbi:MAG: hypothetical protein Kow0074_01030 [Candidatus Zixiibacteriota bacterium]